MRPRVAFLVMLFCFAPSAVFGSGNANSIVGLRNLDDEFWEPVDDQVAFAVNVDFGGKDWPIHLVTGLSFSSDDDDAIIFGAQTAEAKQWELSVGITKIWDQFDRARPFLSSGVSYIYSELDLFSIGEDDDSTGGWFAEAGIYWQGELGANFGFNVRIVEGAEVTLFGVEGDAGYLQVGFLLGFGW